MVDQLIKINIQGQDITPENTRAKDLAEILVDFEESITSTVVSNHTDLKKEEIIRYLDEGKFKNDTYFSNLLYMLPSPIPGSSLFDINELLAKEWHPSKNGNLTPKDVSPSSEKKVWWVCKKGHEWKAMVGNRHKLWAGCPYCSGRKKQGEVIK